METLNREGILRMIGLRDSAGLYSKINSLMIDVYDEGGKLAEYSTRIIQTEKNITLLAQRVTDDETDIADLTVTAQQISATVEHQQDEIDDVTGTVSGHTTQIGQLQVTAQQISASVSSLTTTVNGHTQRIGELVIKDNEITQTVSSLSDDVDAIDGTVTSHTTQIGQLQTTAQQISASVSSLTTTVNGHTSQIGELVIKDNEITQRVTVIEGDYVTSADLSLYVDKNMVSWLTGSANNVVFNFTNAFQIQSNGTAVLTLDSQGNLTILGALLENSEAEALNIKGNSSISYVTTGGSTVDGIRCTSSGVERWSNIFNAWIPLYSQRFARPLVYTSTTTKTLYNDDDYVLSFGQYEKTIVLPSSPADGKVITIANISAVSFIKPNTGQTLNVGGVIVRPTDQGKDLNDYDLAELLYYNGVWYWHYMEV